MKKQEVKIEEVKVSNYAAKVLNVNTKIKEVSKSLGGARAIILSLDKMKDDKGQKVVDIDAKFIQVLTASKKPDNYKVLTKYVTLAGRAKGFSPFRVLQCLNKHIDAIREEMTF